MSNLAEMRARLQEIVTRMGEIHAESAEAPLDEERQTEWDGLDTEHDALKAQIAAVEARMAKIKETAIEQPGAVERGSDPGAPAFHKKPENVYDMEELRKEAYSADDFLARVDGNAKRAIEGARFGVRDSASAQERASELLEDVDTDNRDLAKRMLLTGSPEYERAFAKLMRHGNDSMCTQEERAALVRSQTLSGGSYGSEGGYAVPFQLDPTVILTNAGSVNPIREMARVEQIVGKKWQGVTSAGTTVTRGSETTAAGDNSFTLAQPELATNRVQGFVPFTIEIDLSWNALRREITTVLVDAKNREEDSFITGDGVTGQQPGGVNGSLAAGQDVETAANNTFAAIDVYALEEALDPRWEPNASWLGHKSVYNRIRNFDSSGGAQLWARIGEGRPARLLDYPDYRSSAMPAYSTTSAAQLLLFGDFKQFLIVDRIGMSVEVVPHLFDTTNNRPTGQRGVYAIWMNNSKILVPGAFKRLVVNAP